MKVKRYLILFDMTVFLRLLSRTHVKYLNQVSTSSTRQFIRLLEDCHCLQNNLFQKLIDLNFGIRTVKRSPQECHGGILLIKSMRWNEIPELCYASSGMTVDYKASFL